jgi:hypothetical protein
MRSHSLLVAAGLAAASTCTLSAQVTVNGTGTLVTNSNATNPGTSTYTYTLATPSTSKVIVAGYYNDNGTAISGMTFGGAAASRFSTQGRTAIGCFTLPQPAPATISITATVGGAGAPTAGFFVYELGGVDTSGGGTAIDAGTGATITTSAADKFVINFKGINNSNGAGIVPAESAVGRSPAVLPTARGPPARRPSAGPAARMAKFPSHSCSWEIRIPMRTD